MVYPSFGLSSPGDHSFVTTTGADASRRNSTGNNFPGTYLRMTVGLFSGAGAETLLFVTGSSGK